jgi:hypothetical protein
MEVKMNRTSLLCGNRNGQHGTQNVKTQNRATLKKREETQIPFLHAYDADFLQGFSRIKIEN